MNVITLLQPPRIVFGNGCATGCVELLTQRKVRRVLVVTSSPVLPGIGFLLKALEKAGCDVVQGPPVDREPTRGIFAEVLKVAREARVEGVLGIGGGSALDVAKLVAALAQGRQGVEEVFGINLLQGRGLFLVCLPTTAGTGSEVSPNAILLDEADQLKKGAVSPYLVPDAAVVDPLLTLSVPPGVTAATGLDALTHCIEAYTNKFAHPAVDTYALEGMRLISANLLRAVRKGSDEEARANLVLGSLYGGLCLGPVNTAGVHALSYPLGGQFHVAHGVSNAVLLPHVLRFNLTQAPERYARVARALGADGADGLEANRPGDPSAILAAAERGVEYLARLSEQCGVPQRLSQLGVPREAIPSLAKAAMKVTRLLKNNPRLITEQDAVRIYEGSF
jgi:alcohol dehydrogenase